MIHYCSCIELASSALHCTGKEATSSCMICGQKKFGYGSGSLSESMLSNVEPELSGVNNSELSWKTVSESNKKVIRRARTPVATKKIAKPIPGSWKSNEDLIVRNPGKVEDMPVSESEKLGVSVLGRRFGETLENVPIKKRKFLLFQSPSPPPLMPVHSEDSEHHFKFQSASKQKPLQFLNSEKQDPSVFTSESTDLDVGNEIFYGKSNKKDVNEKCDCADFSGISILAAAACSSDIDCSTSISDQLPVDGSLITGNVASTNPDLLEPNSPTQNLSEKHPYFQSLVQGKTGVCSWVKTDENSASAQTSNVHQADIMANDCQEASITISDNSIDTKQEVLEKNNIIFGKVGASSSRDDRSHWDLNVVMDAWESPCDESSQQTKLHFSPDNAESQKLNLANNEQFEVQMERRDLKGQIISFIRHNVAEKMNFDDPKSCTAASKMQDEFVPESCRADSTMDDKHALGGDDPQSCRVESTMQDKTVPGDDSESCRADSTTQDRPVPDESILANEISVDGISIDENCEKKKEKLSEDSCTVNFNFEDKLPSEVEKPLLKLAGQFPETKLHNGLISIIADSNETKLRNDGPISVIADSNASAPVDYSLEPVVHNNSFFEKGNDSAPCMGFDGERNRDNASHLQEVHEADDVIDFNVEIDNKMRLNDMLVQVDDASDSHGDYPNFGVYLNRSNTVANRRLLSSPVAVSRTDQCADHVEGCETIFSSCLPVKKPSASLGADSSEDLCEVDNSQSSDDYTKRTSALPVEGCDSEMNQVEQNVKTAELVDESGSDAKSSVQVPVDAAYSQHNIENGVQVTVESPAVVGDAASPSANEDHVRGSGKFLLDNFCNSNGDLGHLSQIKDSTPAGKGCSTDEYEDGEFRESFLHCLEDGEAERVDYSSDNTDNDSFEQSMENNPEDCGDCKKEETPSADGYVFEDGTLNEVMNEKDINFQSSDILPAEPSCKSYRKIMVKFSSKPVGKRVDNLKNETNARCSSESSADPKQLLEEEELNHQETCDSTISRLKSTGRDELPDAGRRKEEVIVKEAGEKDCTVSHLVLHSEESSRNICRSKSSRELPSHIERRKCSDASFYKNKVHTHGSRSNNVDGVSARAERDGPSITYMHGRGRFEDHRLESSDDRCFRNSPRLPFHHVPGDHGIPGPKGAAAAAAAKLASSGFVIARDGTILRASGGTADGRVQRQSAKSPSRGMRHQAGRSPTGRDELFNFRTPLDHGHVREISPGRKNGVYRGRWSNRCESKGFGSGHGESHDGPYVDDVDSTLTIHRDVARRRKSLSPTLRRAFRSPHSRTSSPLRSTTRSPSIKDSMWRGNGIGFDDKGASLQQRLSRSPDFGADGRFGRMKSPQRRPSYPEDMVEFIRAPRNPRSPPYGSRWLDHSRAETRGHCRGHYKRSSMKSPRGRGFLRNHSFDMECPERVKHGYFRPVSLRGDSDFNDGGRRHDGSENRRNNAERYRMVDSSPHFAEGAISKHFRSSLKDGVSPPHFRGRGRSPREFNQSIESRQLVSAIKKEREDNDHLRDDLKDKSDLVADRQRKPA